MGTIIMTKLDYHENKGMKMVYRKEIPEYPEEAIREAIVNAIIHRNYFEDRFGVFVEIFDDRVEVTNNGKLLFDRKELGKISVPRNPIIFDIFHRINLIEKVGSGINRIRKQIKERGLKVKFETDDFFRITFYRPKTKENVPEKRLEVILEKIKSNPKINIAHLAVIFGVNEKTIKRDIEKMKQKNIIERIGPAKEGYWKIKNAK